MRGLKLIGGILAIVVGISLGAWLGYNIFIEALPSYQSTEPRKPIKALIFCVAMVVVGCVSVKSHLAASNKKS